MADATSQPFIVASTDATVARDTPKKPMNKGYLALGLIVWILGGLYAGYLSWSCNTAHGFTLLVKVVSALFSFLGSWSYCLTYLFYKSWTCNPKASMARLDLAPHV